MTLFDKIYKVETKAEAKHCYQEVSKVNGNLGVFLGIFVGGVIMLGFRHYVVGCIICGGMAIGIIYLRNLAVQLNTAFSKEIVETGWEDSEVEKKEKISKDLEGIEKSFEEIGGKRA